MYVRMYVLVMCNVQNMDIYCNIDDGGMIRFLYHDLMIIKKWWLIVTFSTKNGAWLTHKMSAKLHSYVCTYICICKLSLFLIFHCYVLYTTCTCGCEYIFCNMVCIDHDIRHHSDATFHSPATGTRVPCTCEFTCTCISLAHEYSCQPCARVPVSSL